MFLQKILHIFDKSQYFSRILRRQISYNLVIKIFPIQKRQIFGQLQLASKRRKKVRVEWMIFVPYYKYGGK